MIKIENIQVGGWEPAIRGMRSPKNSWDRSDSCVCPAYPEFEDCRSNSPCCPRTDNDFKESAFCVGKNDLDLMKRLIHGGTEHRKFLRMIVVYADITAPLYWWKEADTYKVGTVSNSCSTMHKIHEKEFTQDDFSVEHLSYDGTCTLWKIIESLNHHRNAYNNYESMPDDFKKEYTKKELWYNLIQLLPTSYNQRRTVMLNYEVLLTQYRQRKGHKLDEWNDYCKWIETLPYMKEFLEVKNAD